MGELYVISHPLITHKLSIMRNKKTGSKDFRELLGEVSTLIGYEVTRDLPLDDVTIETPITKMRAKMISGKKLTIVPIRRAGLGMVDGLLKLIPTSNVGHADTHKDEGVKLPSDISDRIVILASPMLATGNSTAEVLSVLKKHGCADIRIVSVIASPEGVARIRREYPEVDIYTAALDERLNDHAFIVPGLGDAGDRIFGIK